jgi:hypothetical protein
MAAPNVNLTVQDGQLGNIPAGGEQQHVVCGFCERGDPTRLYAYNSILALVAAHGAGPAVEAAAHSLSVAGGPVFLSPINARVAANDSSGFEAGVAGAVTQSGSGPALTVPQKSAVTSSGTLPPVVTLSGTPLKYFNLRVEITLDGARGTAEFRYSLDGGSTWAESGIVTAATYEMPGTGVTLNFATGTDYATDNVYKARACVPFDNYEVQIEIVDAGILGTSSFRYALDRDNPGGPTWTAPITTPAAPGLYTIPNTGITLNFAAGSYVAGETYSFDCTPPSYNATDVANQVASILLDKREWAFLHLVGQASGVDAPAAAAASASMAVSLDTQMETAATAFRWAFAMIELPDDEDDDNDNLRTAFGAIAAPRVCHAGGLERLTSAISGRNHKRPATWSLAARAAKVSISTDLAAVADGPLPGTTQLLHDERNAPTLDDARIGSLTTIVGLNGFYITNAWMLSAAGSDFKYVQHRRVMDVACRIARLALLPYLSAGVFISDEVDVDNVPTGTIDELSARNIETAVLDALDDALTRKGHVTATSAAVDRTNNVLSTENINVTIGVKPKGYAKHINVTIGFVTGIAKAA